MEFQKKISKELRKLLGNFTLNLGMSIENMWNFKMNLENV